MRQTILSIAAIVSLIIVSVFAFAPRRAQVPRPMLASGKPFVGTFVDASGGRLLIAPRAPIGAATSRYVAFAIDPLKTRMIRCEVDVNRITTTAAAWSDFRSGELVSVLPDGNVATEVKIPPPIPVKGKITALTAASVTVRPDGLKGVVPADRTFRIEPGETRFMRRRMDAAPMRAIALAEMHAGQLVNVYARDDVASAVQIVPPAPILGILRAVSAAAVIVEDYSSTPVGKPGEQTFRLDGSKIEVFHRYFGAPGERADFKELGAGQRVAVTVEDGEATAIAIVHPAIYGSISRLSGNSIVVATTGGSTVIYGPEQTLTIDPGQSKIFLGKLDHVVRTPQTRPARVLRYLPGGTLADLRIGQPVSITARRSTVLSMRVTPLLDANTPSK